MSYQHLTLEERYCLAEFREKGLSIRAIARILKRSPSTISRELKRNRGKEAIIPMGHIARQCTEGGCHADCSKRLKQRNLNMW